MQKMIWVVSVIAVAAVISVLYLFGVKPQMESHEPRVVNLMDGIAVLSMEKVQANALAFQKLRQVLEVEHSRFHKEIMKEEKKLRHEQEELKKAEQSTDKPDPSLYARRQEFHKDLAKLEQLVQSKKEELNGKFSENVRRIESSLEDIVGTVSREKGLKVVLDASIVLYSDELDVTDEIIERLNKRISSVSFD